MLDQLNGVDAVGWTPLHYAAQQNMPGLVRMLIRHGADLHALSGGERIAVTFSPILAIIFFCDRTR